MEEPLVRWTNSLVDIATVRDEVKWQKENSPEDFPTKLKDPHEYTEAQISEAQAVVAMRFRDQLYQLHDDIQEAIIAYLAFYYPKEN